MKASADMPPLDEPVVTYALTDVLDRLDRRLERIETRLDDLEGWRAKVVGLALGAGAVSGSTAFAVLRSIAGG